MSAGIDVVDFLDGVAGATNEIFRLVGSDMQKEAAEASAAVAELIKFVESVKSMTAHHGRIEGVRTKWLHEKATAALARVQGGAE